MRFTFTEKKVEPSEELRKYAEKKIGKIDRLFRQESDAYVTFSIERGRHIAEVTLKNNGMFYRVSESTGDMYASLDSAVDAIERQIRKNKTRLAKRLREGALDLGAAPGDVPAEEPEFDLIRVKRFALKPMTPEEAILQMNLLGHEFFAFRNQEDDGAFAIVYKRKNGGYGLIQDE
ncbi:MAG: ribosome-associated translation inhibitor RaiA [Oscillospiraceae bacterium]|nr:ribosome-associated translation inhibitor RaiA [Oscillospiraceae bacterium]